MKKIEETKETVKSTEFATTIYRIRQERKLTQKEIGDIIGVSDRTISKWGMVQQYQTYVRLGIFAKN